MELNKNSIISALEVVFETAKKSKLELAQFDKVRNEIDSINGYFQTQDIESILIAIIINLNNLDYCKVNKMATYVDLTNIKFLTFAHYLIDLHKRSILNSSDSFFQINDAYNFESNLLTFISKNEPIPDTIIKDKKKDFSFHEFLADVDELSDKKDRGILNESHFEHDLIDLLIKYKGIKLIDYIRENVHGVVNYFLFFDTILDAISSCSNDFVTNLQSTVDDCTYRRRETFNYIQSFIEGKTLLNKLDLIEKDKNSFSNRHYVRLTQKSVKMLEEWEGIKLDFKEAKNTKLQYPESIKKVKLLYNEDELFSISKIDKVLTNTSLQKIQTNLANKNLPIGITSLLHGDPGTGKTATVYELARKHKRAVYKVDISESKSMWFGESEKLIKKIFSDYKTMIEQEKRCPILLFNEADALIGKRKENASNSTSSTENAIQNILLEELENFKGILFATTNLLTNLDSAFERRFLFKVKFAKPSLSNAAKIWKLKLPILTNSQAKKLATDFPFSGGEMDNIARKCIMDDVMGNSVGFETIVNYCKTEKWNSSLNKKGIGFN